MKLYPETQEMIALFDWIRLMPDIEPFCMHIPLERKCSIQQGMILKRMGVKAGTSDIFLAIPMGNYHGLWIEMKVKPNKPTKSQERFLDEMRSKGYAGMICYGADEARQAIDKYLMGYTSF